MDIYIDIYMDIYTDIYIGYLHRYLHRYLPLHSKWNIFKILLVMFSTSAYILVRSSSNPLPMTL